MEEFGDASPIFEAARKYGIAFHLGYAEKTPDGHRYNTAAFVSPRVPADYARNYPVGLGVDLSDYRYLVVADSSGIFLDPVIAIGELVAAAIASSSASISVKPE